MRRSERRRRPRATSSGTRSYPCARLWLRAWRSGRRRQDRATPASPVTALPQYEQWRIATDSAAASVPRSTQCSTGTETVNAASVISSRRAHVQLARVVSEPGHARHERRSEREQPEREHEHPLVGRRQPHERQQARRSAGNGHGRDRARGLRPTRSGYAPAVVAASANSGVEPHASPMSTAPSVGVRSTGTALRSSAARTTAA